MKVVVTLTKEFFREHPKAGKPTHFAKSVKEGIKIHTCRDNYEYWAKKIEALKAANGTLCIREWSGKPYRSPQDTIEEIPSERVHVSTLTLTRLPGARYEAIVDGKEIDIRALATNDGFSDVRDFTAFLNPVFKMHGENTVKLAIIHFNEFEY